MFNKIIKKRRLQMELSQEQAARLCDITLSSYSKLEQGVHKNPQLLTVLKIFNGFGLELNILQK